jgi:hypothetical protein
VQVILVGRWGLALRAAPLVAAIAAAKLVLSELGWERLSVNPLYASLVAATVFLFGFLLAGTLADYKESERLPGELWRWRACWRKRRPGKARSRSFWASRGSGRREPPRSSQQPPGRGRWP